jgi:hypothetical protein
MSNPGTFCCPNLVLHAKYYPWGVNEPNLVSLPIAQSLSFEAFMWKYNHLLVSQPTQNPRNSSQHLSVHHSTKMQRHSGRLDPGTSKIPRQFAKSLSPNRSTVLLTKLDVSARNCCVPSRISPSSVQRTSSAQTPFETNHRLGINCVP